MHATLTEASAAPTASAPLAQRFARHLLDAIGRAPVTTDPFDHVQLESVLPAPEYRMVVGALPPDRYYRELRHSDALLPDGRSARLQFPLLPSNIARLPDGLRQTWTAIAAAVTSPPVVDAWRHRFAAALERTTGRPVQRIRLRPYATLFRDLGGYRISIHPDSPRKAITVQLYLPADDSQLHLGTLFHRRRDDGSFVIAKAMRFAPNTGYAFAVTPTSYHSVDPMRLGDRPRNSMMVIISYDRGPLIEGVRSAQKYLRAWFDRVRGDAVAEAGEGRYETM